ncbi:MAG: TRAP transporter substrate-binding protein [Chromatiales bacterium]|nr:MAG: TRAP transporter substrate-binding protein [Chromatiales bacterium]
MKHPIWLPGVGALLALALALQVSPAADFRLKLHHTLPPVAPAHSTMLVPWARQVEADSGGRLAIDIYPAGQLGGQIPQLVDQARDGVVDIVWTLTGATPGRFPRIEVFEMPFLNAHPVAMNLALYDFVQRHPEEFAEYKLIASFVHTGQALHTRVPVRRAADLQGLKVRIPSRVSGWMVEAMGGVPLGAPISKTPELLSKGVVDGAFLPFEVVPAVKVDELVDYHVTLDNPRSDRFNTQVFVIAMNLAAYERLPPDMRAAIDRNAGEDTARWLGQVWVDNEQPGYELAAASGEVSQLPPEEVQRLRDAVEAEVLARWFELVSRKGLDGPALLAEARALIDARLSATESVAAD